MEVKIKGNVSDITDAQLGFIKSVLQDRGFKNGEAVITVVGKDGDNFMANVKRIAIEKDGETFKMIAKVAPQNEMVRFISNTATVFNNEDIMYKQVLPKFDELQKGAGIPASERFKYPICYGSSLTPMHEIILLEDLSDLNLTILDRFQSLSDDCVRIVLKNFAVFHSLSYALKKQEPETFIALKSSLVDMWTLFNRMPETAQSFQNLELDVVSIIKGDKYKKTIKGKVGTATQAAEKMTKAEAGGKHSVIQHGDAWTNNIMFRLQDDKVMEAILIDYQGSKESNPVCDLLYMIFNCTDYDMRKKHFYDWIDYYHTELDNSLHNFGLKANFVYPKDQLDADLKRYGRVTFGLSVVLSYVTVRKSEDAGKIKKAMERNGITIELDEAVKMSSTDVDNTTLAIFRKKVEGLVDSFIDFGLL